MKFEGRQVGEYLKYRLTGKKTLKKVAAPCRVMSYKPTCGLKNEYFKSWTALK